MNLQTETYKICENDKFDLFEVETILTRSGCRAVATSTMECFVIIVNGWKPLTIITKRSILDVAAVLDPPLLTNSNFNPDSNFFNEKTNSVQSTYYTHEDFVSFSSNLSENFSTIHLNNKSFHKNVDKFKDFLNDIKV